MAKSRTTELVTDRPTYEMATMLGSLDADADVRAALGKLDTAITAHAGAEAALDEQRRDATGHADPRHRRRAAQAIPAQRLAVDELAFAVADARRDVAGARRAAFRRWAPALHAEHQHVLMAELAPALQALAAITERLTAIEKVAAEFRLPSGSSLGPASSPIAGSVADRLGAHLVFWAEVLKRLRPAA